jgi:hypothetical protein
MSFAAPDANGVIFQSGRDYDLSDLASNSGVTTTTDNGITYYDFGTNRFHIQGTVWHDPDKEVMLFHHNSTSNTISTTVFRVAETNDSRGWKTISSWSVDSDGNYVINRTGHSVEVGDALRFRAVTNSAIDQKQARVLSVTSSTITLERGYYWAGLDSNILPTTGGSQYTRIPIYNYGKEYTNNGRLGYSDGTGVIISGSSTSGYDPDEHGFAFAQFSFLWTRGGTIVNNRPCTIEGHYDIKNTTFMSPRQSASGDWAPVEMRNMGDGWWDNGKLININGVDPRNTKQIDVALENACVSEVLAPWYEFSFRNFDASKNFGVCDFGHDGSYGVNGTLSNGSWSGNTVTYHHHDFEIVNSATGSNIITMWRPLQRNANAQRGNVVTKKEVLFNIKDASGNPIEGVELSLIDNPSQYAKNVTYPPAANAGPYTTTPTLLSGVINSDGSVTYDYTVPFEYNATSDSNGRISTLKITTSSHLHEYNANDPAALNDYPNLYIRANDAWGFSSSDTRAPDFLDWDTDNFGGFYRVDRRSNDNTDADEFTFNFCSYGHSLSSSTQVLKGLGELEVNWVLFNDQLITDTKVATDAYQVIDDAEKFYNKAKADLVDNYAGETETIVSRSGVSIDSGDKNIVLDPNAANVFTFDSATNTITIKCTSFTGNLITTTGTITVNSGVTVLGTITDVNNPAGLSSRTFSISNVILGATIQIYNETQVTKRGTTESYSPANVYETLIASGTTTSSTLIGDGTSTIAQLITAQSLIADPMADTTYVLPSGWTLATTEVTGAENRITISGIYDEGAVPNGDFDVGDSVRIRATCAASTGAFIPFVNTTIANQSGFSIRVNQQPDTIYNNNGIDGSSSNFDSNTLTLTPDYSNFQIDVSDSDTNGVVTVQQIYAKYSYLITTTEGIENFFGAITAENTSNYRIHTDVIDLKIQNISANDTILTGARLYRSDNQTVITKGYLNNDANQGLAGTLSHDTGEFLQYIQPQVTAAMNEYGVAGSNDFEPIKNNTNLIPGLL